MRYLLFLYLSVYSISLNAQLQIYAKNLPVGIKQHAWTIKGHDNLVEVEKSKNYKMYYGVYDLNGKEVIPCNYLQLSTYEDKIIVKGENGKWGMGNISL